MADRDDTLKIEVTGKTDSIPVDSFLELVGNLLQTLRDLDTSISHTENPTLDWEIISASLSSPLAVTIEGRSGVGVDVAPEVIRAYLDGVEHIEKGRPGIPAYFTDSSLRTTQKMASVLVDDGIKQVAFSAPNHDPVMPSKKILENVKYIMQIQREATPEEAEEEVEATPRTVELHARTARRREERASLTGTLETVTVHGGTPKFVIYDPLTGSKTDCFISDELLSEVKEALPSRVRVTGTARYGKRGFPTSIQVETFRRLRSRGELPGFRDLEGINFSGSLDPTEYIRRLRDG